MITQAEAETRGDLRRRYRVDEPNAGSQWLAAIFARARPEQPAFMAALDAVILGRIARGLQGLAVKWCNTGLTERDERRRTRLGADAGRIAAIYGLEAKAYGDPRGYVLTLHGDNLPSNNLGDGFGVSWR